MAVRRKPTARSPFDSTYSIGSTHAEAVQHNDAAAWNYDPPTPVLLPAVETTRRFPFSRPLGRSFSGTEGVENASDQWSSLT
ncbi:hypothetical protein DP107_14700 [Haloglomus irregulare]|uniref:Uncharacterized protein n=1 Tax=Haloglomus irregulare TaxID=2234134 RepID=A0A554MWX4_9EURY|nr:hypothetical protein DP107_14700 [Haloglomus irregulare]